MAVVSHTNTQNNTMKQNTQNGTYRIRILKLTKEYITIRIHNLQFKQKRTKHTTIYEMIQNRTRRIWEKNVINETAIQAANCI